MTLDIWKFRIIRKLRNHDTLPLYHILFTHRCLQFPQPVPVSLGKVREIRVETQSDHELVDGRHDQVDAPQVGLEVHGALAAGELQFLEESHSLEGQVGDCLHREDAAAVMEGYYCLLVNFRRAFILDTVYVEIFDVYSSYYKITIKSIYSSTS